MMKNKASLSLLRPSVVIGALALFAVLGYSLFAALPYLEGPALAVHETTTGGLTTISGTTARVAYLSIDGGAVPLEESGAFSAVRAYPPGYTDIHVRVTDRFGRSRIKTLTFITK